MDKAIFIKEGKTLDITPTNAIACGTILIATGLVCLALCDIEAGKLGTVKVLQRGEVVKATTATAIGATDAGTAIYVTSAGVLSKTADGNKLVGYAAAAVGATDTTFEIVCA